VIDWWVALVMLGVVALLVAVEHRRAERWRALAVNATEQYEVGLSAYYRAMERVGRLRGALARIEQQRPEDLYGWVNERREAGNDLCDLDWFAMVAREALEADRDH